MGDELLQETEEQQDLKSWFLDLNWEREIFVVIPQFGLLSHLPLVPYDGNEMRGLPFGTLPWYSNSFSFEDIFGRDSLELPSVLLDLLVSVRAVRLWLCPSIHKSLPSLPSILDENQRVCYTTLREMLSIIPLEHRDLARQAWYGNSNTTGEFIGLVHQITSTMDLKGHNLFEFAADWMQKDTNIAWLPITRPEVAFNLKGFIPDDSISEEQDGDEFVTEAYLLPVQDIDGVSLLYREYLDYREIGVEPHTIEKKSHHRLGFWTDRGVRHWIYDVQYWDAQFILETRQRIVLERPDLALRITGVRYNPEEVLEGKQCTG